MGAQYTSSQAKASSEYLKKLDRITIRVPKGTKEKYKRFADSKGQSLNQFIIDCIERGCKKLP